MHPNEVVDEEHHVASATLNDDVLIIYVVLRPLIHRDAAAENFLLLRQLIYQLLVLELRAQEFVREPAKRREGHLLPGERSLPGGGACLGHATRASSRSPGSPAAPEGRRAGGRASPPSGTPPSRARRGPSSSAR